MAKTKLDLKVQKSICALLTKGATDKTACENVGITPQTFYNWMSRGEKEGDGEFFEFFEAVTRARAKAHHAATVAFHSGLTISRAKEKVTKTYTETRLKSNGDTYDYKEVTTTEILRINPPDWRAGEAWLKRRDPANWSDKLMIEIDTKQLESLLALLKQKGLNPSDIFEGLIQEIANVDSTGNRAE